MSFLRTACLLMLGLIGLGLVAATPGQAQTALVRGFVTDAATGQPLQGATVALLRDTVLVTGTATDGDGLYVLPRLAPGTVRLRVSFVGYRPRTDTLRLRPDAVRTVNVALAPAAAALEEVVVEEAGVAAQAGQRTLRPADLAALPAPDVTGDLANALTAQPGIVTTGDQGGRLYVRGGEPSQNLVLVDGMPVYQPVHLVGLYSALPADVVQRADVYAGGFGPEFGGRLSSVIDVTTRSGNLRRLAGAASLSPFVSGLRLEGPLAPGAASVLISARRSFVDEVAGPLVGTDLPYRFDDQFVKVSGLPSPNSRLSVQALRTYDRGTFGSADPDLLRADRITWTNYAAGARLLMLPAARPISAEVVASFSYLDMTVGPEDTPLRASSIAQGQATADVTHYLGAFDLHWGLFVGTSAYSYELGGLFQIPDAERTFATEAGGYVAFAVRADRLELAPGLRIYALPNQRQVFAEPRGRVQFTAGRHRVQAAAGLYHQQIVGLTDKRDATGLFTAWTRSPLGGAASARHGLIGYTVDVAPGLTLSAEAYAKAMETLYAAAWTPLPSFSTGLVTADGTARGLEVTVEGRRGPWRADVRYSRARVEYRSQVLSPYTPAHDRRHQLTVLGQTTLGGVDFGVRWQFGSGLPFSRPFGFDAFVLMDGPIDPYDVPDQVRVVYGIPFNDRLPTYHRLDVSAARTVRLQRAALTVQASVLNAYDRANLLYLDLFTFQRTDQLPLTPALALRIRFE